MKNLLKKVLGSQHEREVKKLQPTVAEINSVFQGLSSRSDEKLKLNYLWLLLYITSAQKGHESRIWLDHVVVAKSYIGPIGVKKKKRK